MSEAAAPHRAVSALLAVAFTLVGCTGGSLSSLRAGKSVARPDQTTRPGGATTTAPTGIVTPSPASLPAAAQGNNARATRDPALWPFAATSPWNYPIGSNATYAPVVDGYGRPFASAYVQSGQYTMAVYIAQLSDPLVSVIRDDRTSTGGPTHVYPTNRYARRIPPGAGPAPVAEGQMIIITPDHLTATEFYDAHRDATGNWHNGAINLDLKGPGWNALTDMCIQLGVNEEATPINALGVPPGRELTCDAIQTAAGTSDLGGLIRAGELVHGIPHALAVITDTVELNHHAPGGQDHVWPAIQADTGASSSYTSHGNLYMGSLLAIPASTNINALGLRTVEGKNIALALQRYGGYIRDTSGPSGAGADTFFLAMDYTARAEQPASAVFSTDMNIIAQHVRVVTNSFNPRTGGAPQGGVKLNGGDGTLPAPTAPPFDR